MVKIMENPIKMDDLGGKPTIFGKHPYTFNPEKKNWWKKPSKTETIDPGTSPDLL